MSTYPPAPRRLLAIKLADLGDVLNITPALRALRHTFPQATIDVLLNPHTTALLQDSPLVDRVLVFPKTQYEGLSVLAPWKWPGLARYLTMLRRQQYDTVIDFHHLTTRLGRLKQRLLLTATAAPVTVGLDNGHGSWFSHPVPDEGFGVLPEVGYWLALARRLGATSDDTSLAFTVPPAAEQAIAEKLTVLPWPAQPFVVMHPGSGGFSLARRWEPAKYATLAAHLWQRHHLPAILVGGPGDDGSAVAAAATSPMVDWSGQTSLPELAALLQRARLFVGTDSGVMHMAAAMRTPLVAIFGPSNHRAWAPWTPYSPSHVVRLDLSCSPCTYVDHRLGWRHGCPERTCLAELDVDPVLAAAEHILAQEQV